MTEIVVYEVSDGVATVTLNRPAAMNALDVALKTALAGALRRAADDNDVRAVLLTGNGRAFCVGQDLREHLALLDAGDPAPLSTVRDHYNPLVRAITELPKPVLAAVNGVAAGAGLGLALACDLRLAADSASFTTAFTRIGLTADSGLSWTLPRVVGLTRATELLLLSEVLDADRALADGLVHRVLPAAQLAAAAGELAQRLAAGPTVAYAAVKAALAFGASHDLASTLELEADLQGRCGVSADHAEGVAAFVGKRPPEFTGR